MDAHDHRSGFSLPPVTWVLPLMMLTLPGCVPPPPHQFVPGGPMGEASQTLPDPRPAGEEEVRAMLAESSRALQPTSDPLDLPPLLRRIEETANFRQRQRLIDRYHHAALLLPVEARHQAFQQLRETIDRQRGGQ